MPRTRSSSQSSASSSNQILSPDDIPSLSGLYDDEQLTNVPLEEQRYPYEESLNRRVGLLVGDITFLSTTFIANAANTSLLGGGGVDGAIHRAAGPELLQACRPLGGCETGDAKLTAAFRLPSQKIAHTPGPIYSPTRRSWCEQKLSSSYRRPLELLRHEGGGSIAFPCISAGVYGYPIVDQAHVAIKTIRETLSDPAFSSIEKVIFCQFSQNHYEVYEQVLPIYFPGPPVDENEEAAERAVTKAREIDELEQERMQAVEAVNEEKDKVEESEVDTGKDDEEVAGGVKRKMDEVEGLETQQGSRA